MATRPGTPTGSHPVAARRRPAARRISHLAMAATIGLSGAVLAACGGSNSSSGTSTTKPSTATEPSTAPGGRTSSTAPGPDPNAPEVVAPGDIPDNQAFVPYQAAGGFTVKVPEGWARTDVAVDHVSFSDKYNTIDLTWKPQTTPPTEASVQAAIEAQGLPGFSLTKVSTVQRAAGPVVVATYGRTSDPNPVTGKRIVLDVEQYGFWRNGTSAVLTLSGAKGSDNVDPWKIVTNSVGWTR
jgi:hypothetical protein